jgi:hypothetical protein
MGVLKIWHMNPDVVESQGMLQHVQQLLAQDSDAQVLGNCVTLLMQVQGVKRISSNKMLMYTLINRIKVRLPPGVCGGGGVVYQGPRPADSAFWRIVGLGVAVWSAKRDPAAVAATACCTG